MVLGTSICLCLFLISSVLSLCAHFFYIPGCFFRFCEKYYFNYKKHWHSDIRLELLLVPATEIEDNRAIYKF